MKYLVSKKFTKIEETTGTVQNADKAATLEVSTENEPGTGVLVAPAQKISFNDQVLYVRCVDGFAEVRVVPFETGEEGGGVGGIAEVIIADETYSVAKNVDISNLLDDIFGGN